MTLRSQEQQHYTKIIKPAQSLPLQTAKRLLRAQPDSVANHVTARSISDWRGLTSLATETGWARRKHSAICSGKLSSVYMIWSHVNRKYGITGWAVALTCCISHSAKYRKKADFDPSGSQNPLTNFDKTWHGWLRSGSHSTWKLWWG